MGVTRLGCAHRLVTVKAVIVGCLENLLVFHQHATYTELLCRLCTLHRTDSKSLLLRDIVQMHHTLLTTHNFIADPTFKENLAATVEDLLDMNVVPVFNENDAISKGVVKATVGIPASHPQGIPPLQ